MVNVAAAVDWCVTGNVNAWPATKPPPAGTKAAEPAVAPVPVTVTVGGVVVLKRVTSPVGRMNGSGAVVWIETQTTLPVGITAGTVSVIVMSLMAWSARSV